MIPLKDKILMRGGEPFLRVCIALMIITFVLLASGCSR